MIEEKHNCFRNNKLYFERYFFYYNIYMDFELEI